MDNTTKFDQLLTRLGTGPWNIIHFIACGIWSVILSLQLLDMIFLAPALSYTCVPGHNTTALANDSCSYTRLADDGESEIEEPCTEWDFDKSVYKTTLTEEFGLVCRRGYLHTTYMSIYTIACIFGCLVTGYATDRYGRKKVGIVSVVLFAVVSILTAVVRNFSAILFLRFMAGALHSPTIYMQAIEVCQVKHRTVVGILLGLPWALGFMLEGAIAYGLRTWRYLQLAVSLPTLILIPLLCFTNEPPRWLIVRGQHKEALRVLRRAARLNRVTLPSDDILTAMLYEIEMEALNPHHATEELAEKEVWIHKHQRRRSSLVPPMVAGAEANPQMLRSSSMSTVKANSLCAHHSLKLVSTGKMRLVFVILTFVYFATAMIYYGISFNATGYSNDPFLYTILSGLMEMPGYIFSVPVVAKWGRKPPIIIGFFLTGATLLSLVFIPKDISWLMMTLTLVGKIFITAMYMTVVVYSAEVFPTEVRVQGTAWTFVAAQVAASLAPYIILKATLPWLPSVIFGVCGFVASILMCPLPETRGQYLPDTISDLDRLWAVKKK